MNPQQISATGLGAGLWSVHQLGPHSIVRAQWQLRVRPDLWHWLESQSDWAFVWKSRSSASLWMGAGAMLQLDHEEMSAAGTAHGLPIFGGHPFGPSSSAMWGELAAACWIVPQVLIHEEGDSLCLSLHTLAKEPDASTRQRLQAKLATLLSSWSLQPSSPPSPLPPYIQRCDRPEPAQWMASIEHAIAAMRGHDLVKVVMSRSVELRFDRTPSWIDALRHLLAVPEEAFIFALKTPSQRVFMGRSPERLLAWNDDSFSLDAIAGTRSRASSQTADREAGRDLQESPKEQHEHRLVSDAIARLLTSEQLAFEAIEEEQLLRLQHVQHMRTRFEGQWNGPARGFDLLQRLHPTPAVGGVPVQAALAFITRFEAFERGWFAGYIGLVVGASAEFAIGIRSALWHQKQLHIFAGAGIVVGSEPAAEWQETELKMQNFLGLWRPRAAQAAGVRPLHV